MVKDKLKGRMKEGGVDRKAKKKRKFVELKAKGYATTMEEGNVVKGQIRGRAQKAYRNEMVIKENLVIDKNSGRWKGKHLGLMIKKRLNTR